MAAHDKDLELAHRMADAAAAIALRHFHTDRTSRPKADGTPVTAADIEVDQMLVDLLRQERPDDAVLSEEGGAVDGTSGRRWILDPIDGTMFFAAGERGWSTYIALEDDGDLVLGMINQPVDRRRYWATRGHGTRTAPTDDSGLVDGEARTVKVSTTAELADARFMALVPAPEGVPVSLRETAQQMETTADFIIDLIEGRVDLLYCQGGEVWDHAAEVILVEEAGGRYRDSEGGRRLDLRGGTYCNGALDTELGALLGRW